MLNFSHYQNKYKQLTTELDTLSATLEGEKAFFLQKALFQLGSLLQDVGRPTSALSYLLRADEAGFSFKYLGAKIATAYHDMGEVEYAFQYLNEKITTTNSKYHRERRDYLENILAESDVYSALGAERNLSPVEAATAVQSHLRARRFGLVKKVIEDQEMLKDGSPKMRGIYEISKREIDKKNGHFDISSAVKLSSLYLDVIRSRPQAALALSDLNDLLICSENNLWAAGSRLVAVGNPVAAARYAYEYQQRDLDSLAARRLLVFSGQAMGDGACIVNAVDSRWMVDELTQAHKFAAAYFENMNINNEAQDEKFDGIFLSTSKLLTALSLLFANKSANIAINLRTAAYILNDKDKSLLLGLPSEVIHPLSQLPGLEDTPSFAILQNISKLVSKNLFPLEIKRPYIVKSLLETCVEVQDLNDTDGDEDVINLLSTDRGLFRPKPVSDIAGVPVDGWSIEPNRGNTKGRSPRVVSFTDMFQTAPVHLARLKAAALIGRGFLLNRNGAAISDVQNDGVRRCYLNGKLQHVQTGWLRKARVVVGSDNASLIYAFPLSSNVNYVGESCYLLDNGQGYNFANWHMYIYPRLYAYFEAGLDKKNVKLVVYRDTNPRLLEFLRGYGVSDSDLYFHDDSEVSIFLNLYVPSAMSFVEMLVAPQAFLTFDRVSVDSLVASGADSTSRWPQGSIPRKVYLSRSDVARRRLVNEARIEEIARKHGYEVVLPAQLSTSDVLRLFREVDVICGPSGSSFLNMLYMKPQSHSIMISHPAYSPTAYLCCQFGGLRDIGVSLIFGEMTGGEQQVGQQEEFKVDESAVEAILAKY